MTDKNLLSTHNSLLDKWTKSDSSSLGGLSLSSGKLSGTSSLLSTSGTSKPTSGFGSLGTSLSTSLSGSSTLGNKGSSLLSSSTLGKPSLLSSGSSLQSKLSLSSTTSSLLRPSSLLTSTLTPSGGLLSSKSEKAPAIESSLNKLSLASAHSPKYDTKASERGTTKYGLGSAKKRLTKDSQKTEKKKKVVGHGGEVMAQVIRRHAIKAPDYFIKCENEEEYMDMDIPQFVPPSEDMRLAPSVARSLTDVVGIKRGLINWVSGSLISQPDFTKKDNPMRLQIVENVTAVVEYDPEFILKVALYSRKELHIRTTSNFLLALAASISPCRQFLKKYFSASIALPSDWIEVAEIFQTLEGGNLKLGSLPAALRKAMINKFPEFDKYQLAKYNKDSSGKKKAKKAKKAEASKKKKTPKKLRLFDSDSSDDEDDEDKNKKAIRQLSSIAYDEKESSEQIAKQHFTIKQLIRKLHIREPVEHIMSIIGKKYPLTMEDFYQSRLPGTFEEERAGKRMKLPVPETWETQVSLKGNKAQTWQDLIDHKKLPFMAMLRNLRNLIKAGISPKHHNFVLRRLSDQRSVINSKQFPFRFFSAYVVLQELEEAYEKNQEEIIAKAEAESEGRVYSKVQTGFRGRGRGARGAGVRGGGVRGRGAKGRGGRRGASGDSDGQFAWWVLRKQKKDAAGPTEVPYDKALLQRYRKALDTAVKIATVHNVQPIKGRTILLCDISQKMNKPCSSARGLGKPRTLREISVLMGLMCKYSCEECEMIVFNDESYKAIELRKGTILDNMNAVLDCELPSDSAEMVESIPYQVLLEKLRDRVQVDNLLVFGEDYYPDCDEGRVLVDFLKNYRHLVNPNLLFVAVTFSSPRAGFTSDIQPEHDNDIYISGYSDAILRFVAERGDAGMVNHVDKIDEAFQLRPMPRLRVDQQEVKTVVPEPERSLRLTAPTPRWRTVRVFISSTFRDMHGERDLLTRFVFPELRALGRKHFINVYEVDLRWGISEEQAKDNCTVSLCLQEVARCDIFIGVLGERYGWTPLTYEVPDSPEYDWVRQYAPGASVTELEMQLGALSQPAQAKDTAFFFMRNNSFETDVPAPFEKSFKSESDVHKAKMSSLKSRIRKSGLEVFNYPCHWGGCVDGKPVVSGLEEFGARMLNTLLNAVKKMCPDEDGLLSEEVHIDNLHWALVEQCHSEFIGRKNLLKQAVGKIYTTSSGVIGLFGKSGSGKTALMSSVIMEMVKSKTSSGARNVFINMAGAAPGSTNLAATVRHLAMQVNSRFALGFSLPEDFKNLCLKFGDLLSDAANMCTTKLVVFLDGLDMMEDAYQPYSLEWLPSHIPDNVVFVISAITNEKTFKSLKRLRVDEMIVGDLDMWDKAELVRQTLAKHRKSLDESGFGNQMKLLMLKKEAHNPLYLKLACEELRVFGVFEKVSDKLKGLPHTTAQMLQEVLERLESDHGVKLVSTALCLLACARDGLYPEELYELLSWYSVYGSDSLEPRDLCKKALSREEEIPPVTLTFLARSIMSFLNPSSTWAPMLSLANAEICTAVRLRYLKGTAADMELSYHKFLAAFFMRQADPTKDDTWQSQNVRAFSELPYHLACGGCFTELARVLCNHKFIQAKCSLGMAAKLLDDFTPKGSGSRAMEREQNRFLSLQSVQQYKSFIFRNINILVNYPSLEWQQAINEPSHTLPYEDAFKMQQWSRDLPAYMEWSNKPEEESQCYLTLSNFKESVNCVAVSPNCSMFAAGSQDLLVRLYDMATGKELKFFHGHSDAVTDICFAGNDILCSGSVDTTLCLWDVTDGHRIHTLKGHGRRVNSCASDSQGKLIASGGWDCMVNVWNTAKGDKLCEFNIESPVNCVDFHPSEELVVVGSWDSLIRIYNYFHKTRVAILRGHSTSVRDIAYSIDGRHLASAAMDGDVKIWAADKGSQVGNVKGHAGPVNKLIFSPSGREIITAGEDHQVKVWSGDLGIPVHRLDTQNNGAATSVCISPSGLMLAVGYHLGQVRIYDVNTGVKMVEIKLCPCAVRALCYSQDGGYILAGCDDNKVQILESTQGSRVCSLIGHSKPILCVTTSKSYVASCGEDFTCCIYENIRQLKSQRESKPTRILKGHIAPVTSCSFNSDETMIITASRDASVRVYSMSDVFMSDDAAPLNILHDCHADWINASQWSNTGSFLVTGSNDFNLKVWDMKTSKEKVKMTGHSSAINAVAYKFGCIISGSTDGTVKVWSHKGVEITTLRGHDLRVNACDMFVKYSAKGNQSGGEEEEPPQSWADMVEDKDGEKEGQKPNRPHSKEDVNVQEVIVVSAGDDGAVWIWKPLQAYSLACLTGHSDRVLAVAGDRNGQVTSCSLDKSVRVWRPRLEDSLDLSKHDGPVTFVASSVNGELIISGSRDGVVKIWKKDGKTCGMKLSFQAHERAVNCGSFQSASTTLFYTGGDDYTITTWSITDRKDGFFVRQVTQVKVDYPVASILCSPQTNLLFFSTWRGDIYASHAGVLKSIFRVEEEMNDDVKHWPTCLSANPDNQREIVAGTTQGSVITLRLSANQMDVVSTEVLAVPSDDWDRGMEEAKIPRNFVNCCGKVNGMTFGGDSRGQVMMVTGDVFNKSTVKIHKSAVTSVEVFNDIAITASADCSIKVWRIVNEGDICQIGQFQCPSPVTCMRVVSSSREGLVIAAGDQLGNLHQLVWHLAGK
ncbi:telomerase protein component 1 [Aplysia californica]|uniref:Telomerase protein component 1 n=1 Tax=Aplysia californica TaxID=6500 RepID=A0ABM1VQ69_APLCA|nr:telomerase protein component 1 [Aplysia californica]XP_012935536.1 telomerase protein component 1 [Aplysia californica]XP_035824561.1 telomerase protein component 1 [Aplysia californica]